MLDRLPIRWRLALLSAGLTFAILCAFSLVVGELTQRRIRSDFNHQVSGTAEELAGQIVLNFNPRTGAFGLGNVNP